MTLENNWFATPVGHQRPAQRQRARLLQRHAGVTIRNNSFNDVISLDDDGNNPLFTSFVVTGNIGELLSSATALAARHRVLLQRAGGARLRREQRELRRRVPVRPNADDATLDFHLTGGPAVDRIPAALAGVTRDIDGDARPRARASTPAPTRSGASRSVRPRGAARRDARASLDELAVPELEHQQRPDAAGLGVGAGGVTVEHAADRVLAEPAARERRGVEQHVARRRRAGRPGTSR